MNIIKKTRKLSESLKKQVAYEQSYKCHKCQKILPSSYQIDHVIPFSVSLDDSRDNLVALCPNCHAEKTQYERSRIIYYKKIKALHNINICYFCLEEKNLCYNSCKRIYKDIPKEQITNVAEYLYKYSYTPKESDLSSIFKNTNLNDENILFINITRDYIHINNFFTKTDLQITPAELANLIKEVTKNDYNKYSEVHIDIFVKNEGGEGGDACIEYLSSLLPKELPDNIFKDNVKFIYYVDDD